MSENFKLKFLNCSNIINVVIIIIERYKENMELNFASKFKFDEKQVKGSSVKIKVLSKEINS